MTTGIAFLLDGKRKYTNSKASYEKEFESDLLNLPLSLQYLKYIEYMLSIH